MFLQILWCHFALKSSGLVFRMTVGFFGEEGASVFQPFSMLKLRRQAQIWVKPLEPALLHPSHA